MPVDETTGTDLQAEDQPSPEQTDSPRPENNGEPEGSHDSSFLDEYDLGEVTDPEARAAAESYIKRVNAGYTRQRQQDAQAVRDAQQYQEIVDGLLDPETAPGIAQALGLSLAEAEDLADELDDEFDLQDPRVDALKAELDVERETRAVQERVSAENQYITEQIEDLEDELETEFADEEIELLCLLADEYRDGNGVPDVKAGLRIFEAGATATAKRQAAAKKRAARRPGQGSPADRKVDLDDPEKRLEAGLAAAREVRASSE